MYKRNEPFRFSIVPPVSGTFLIARIGENKISSKPGAMEVSEISPSGLRLIAPLDINKENDVDLEVNFTLNEVKICLTGNIIWKKQESGKYIYGLQMLNNDQEKEQLIEELKIYSKNQT